MLKNTTFTIATSLPTTAIHVSKKQYCAESKECINIIEKVINDDSICSTFNHGIMKARSEATYCIDINTSLKKHIQYQS